MFSYYSIIIILAIFSMIIMEWCVSNNSSLTTKSKQLFAVMYLVIMICAAAEWLGLHLQGRSSQTRVLHIIVKTIELSLAPWIGVLCTAVVNQSARIKKVAVIMFANAILECISAFTGFIFYVDQNNIYMHGKYYWIYILAYSIGGLFCIIQSFRSMNKYQFNGYFFMILLVIFVAFGLSVQSINSAIKVDWVILAIIGMMIYILNNDMIQQTDPLTYLLNRRGYENYTAHVQENVVILYFDVNQFKEVNDTYGHNIGDLCLKRVGESIRNTYATYGKCFRIGGDEFCVILSKEIANVDALNESFDQSIRQLRKEDYRMPNVSIGYAYYDPCENNIQDAIREADEMLYRNKEKHDAVRGM